MPSSTDIPVITAEKIAELSERTGTTFFRSRRALQAAGGDMARAVQLLSEVKEQRSTRTPQYGTELTQALGAVPGFAHGYREASRQLEFGRQNSSRPSARRVRQRWARRSSRTGRSGIRICSFWVS